MRIVDIETWPRRDHFRFLKDWDYPHFSMCTNVDLTKFYPAVKQCDVSINVAIVYVIARAANAIPEFRLRIQGDDVVEYEVIHPSTTILTDDNLFSFCPIEYTEVFFTFVERAMQQTALVKEQRKLESELGREELFYMTAIPWVSFTSFMHPLILNPADSVPRFAWGKFFWEGGLMKMPLSVQGHHALLDGFHMGRLYEEAQRFFHHPDLLMGEV